MVTHDEEDAEYGLSSGDDDGDQEMSSLLQSSDLNEAVVCTSACTTRHESDDLLVKFRLLIGFMATALVFFFLGLSVHGGSSDASLRVQNEELCNQATDEKIAVLGVPGESTVSPDLSPTNTSIPEESADVNGFIGYTLENGTISETAAPTSAPTVSPFPSPLVPKVLEDDPSFLPHLPFGNDLQYRRICSPVHSSILCLTIRFPFPVKAQDPKYDYPRPVDERFYDIKTGLRIIDGESLRKCANDTQSNSLIMDNGVKECLDFYMAALPQDDQKDIVSAVWTRRRMKDQETHFYGTEIDPEQQGQRVDKFFDKQLVWILGASPTPGIAKCIMPIFGDCYITGIPPVSVSCKGHHSRQLPALHYSDLPLDETFFGVGKWYPGDKSHGLSHVLPYKNLTTEFLDHDMGRGPGFKELRKVTIIIEYPIAHVQNQNMIMENYQQVVDIQKGFTELTMNAQTEDGRKELAEMGYELERIIAFDGVPQFNPTVTGAYHWGAKGGTSEKAFLDNKGYDGWIPEYGSKCRGPLPPTSNLTGINKISRQAFADNDLDMKFYGRTWEFANQFWYMAKMWNGKGGQLDCTHSSEHFLKGGTSGMACMHKFFVMTMIDDHFDHLEESG